MCGADPIVIIALPSLVVYSPHVRG